jgi:hypothetical protein
VLSHFFFSAGPCFCFETLRGTESGADGCLSLDGGGRMLDVNFSASFDETLDGGFASIVIGQDPIELHGGIGGGDFAAPKLLDDAQALLGCSD